MKIATKIGNNPELDKFLQDFCNQNGIYWGGGENFIDGGIRSYGKDYHLFVDDNYRHGLVLTYGPSTVSGTKYVDTLEFMETVKKTKFIAVELNESYTAVVTKKNVKVGCQTFTHEAILAVAEAIKKLTRD
jgi:hypothetical protein